MLCTISTVKGDFAIHLDYAILGHVIPAKNSLESTDEYEWKQNKVKLYVPLYDTDNGKFWGLDTHLAFIMVRGDADKTFFSYGYDESKSNLLYSVSKKIRPNIFQGKFFKKYVLQILEERSACEFYDILFYFHFIRLIACMKTLKSIQAVAMTSSHKILIRQIKKTEYCR